MKFGTILHPFFANLFPFNIFLFLFWCEKKGQLKKKLPGGIDDYSFNREKEAGQERSILRPQFF
jgi:hypothetical protein